MSGRYGENPLENWAGDVPIVLTSPTIQGEVNAGTGLTMPAFSLGGAITASVGSGLVRTATKVVAASDSSIVDKVQADYVCDGTADEVEINGAITAAGAGGTVHLAKGTYKIAASILMNQYGTILKGSGWGFNVSTGVLYGTIIEAQVVMTNSLLASSYMCRVQDLIVDGNDKAVQFQDSASYNLYDHIGSVRHTTYNFWQSGNGAHITNASFFIGKPIRIRLIGTIDGNTYLQGNGTDPCVFLDNVASFNLIGCTLESYLGSAITSTPGATGNRYGINILGCYFESAFTVSAVILFDDTWVGLHGAVISGNYQADDALTTYFANIYGGSGIQIKSNMIRHPIYIGTEVKSIEAEDIDWSSISYNSQTGLKYLKIDYSKIKIIYGTAAPTTGTWAVGDKVWNTAPVSGGAPGWVCTTAGTPGIWKAMASLA